MEEILDSLDVLLDQLAVGAFRESDAGRRGALYRDFAFQRAASIVRADEDEQTRRRFELRLRLAMHLSPREAIHYDRANPVPRWRLVREHLIAMFGRDPERSERLARDVAVVLDNWEREREDVGRHKAFLMSRDGAWCATCRVPFVGGPPITLQRRDEYKPYHLSPDELLTVEVDHVDAISGLGTNVVENLQLLCRLCNGGKSDGLGVDVRMEARLAGKPVADVPRAHRARMLYYVIQRDTRRCAQCGSDTAELTVRPLVPGGGYLRSNLQAVCVGCAF